MRPEAIILAKGKHELRGAARQVEPRYGPPSAGLRTAISSRPDLERVIAGTIELHLFDGGYAGLLLQEDGAINLCLSVSRARLADGRDALMQALGDEAPLLIDRVGDHRGSGSHSRRLMAGARTSRQSF